MEASLAQAAADVRGIAPGSFTEPRYVGAKRLPTTVIGLLVHIAEHTQRHVGQAVTASKLARAYSSEASSDPSGRAR